MEEAAADSQADEPARADDEISADIVIIEPHGDAMLDVVFETSTETLKSAHKANRPRPGQRAVDGLGRPVLKRRIRVAYRVEIEVLRKQSKYFNSLLGDTRFREAKVVAAALKTMSLRSIKPAQLEPAELPWIRIDDDDDVSRSAGREVVFAELLRILHGKETIRTAKNPPSLPELAAMAILSDRFDCSTPASVYVRNLRFKFPQAVLKPPKEDGDPPAFTNEEAIRQKILVSWLLDQPLRFQAGTRELITYGSKMWSPYADHEESRAAAWWDLPDELERELQTRRECLLNCVASVPRHFIGLYTSRDRQCKLGYGSSSACDSFQLGEMIKFLSTKGLLYFVDFSPASLDRVPDCPVGDINNILAALKQCPSYQIDKNHTNCGLRTRLLPIVEYIQTMLSSNIIAVTTSSWRKNRTAATWAPDDEKRHRDQDEQSFRFTRSLAGDQRLRYEGALAADRMAKQMFTATTWDWTPED